MPWLAALGEGSEAMGALGALSQGGSSGGSSASTPSMPMLQNLPAKPMQPIASSVPTYAPMAQQPVAMTPQQTAQMNALQSMSGNADQQALLAKLKQQGQG